MCSVCMHCVCMLICQRVTIYDECVCACVCVCVCVHDCVCVHVCLYMCVWMRVNDNFWGHTHTSVLVRTWQPQGLVVD